ncbi:hypothetical protein FHS90_003537 [Rufibacter quisquiliarum]|uniref:Uncharacterized protein n=1 Tax=Rufibacter quisquiliarum TaxID=1549639 RepID=A0A839GVC1_9BACT|nr:hypothetical protein [Rufibacter quisquiliarum]
MISCNVLKIGDYNKKGRGNPLPFFTQYVLSNFDFNINAAW